MRKFYDIYLDGPSKGSLSKLYFAKYFPVEGEIKEGDMFLNRFGKISKCPKGGFLIYEPDKVHGDKLVKLFLCSRDIQVGDKVNFKYRVKEITKNEGNNPDEKKLLENGLTHWFSFEDGGLGTNKDTVKVIGEISPGTKWVKEGDEFDEGEVKFMEFIAMMGSDEVSYERFKEFKGDHNYISLKGPCGYFH